MRSNSVGRPLATAVVEGVPSQSRFLVLKISCPEQGPFACISTHIYFSGLFFRGPLESSIHMVWWWSLFERWIPLRENCLHSLSLGSLLRRSWPSPSGPWLAGLKLCSPGPVRARKAVKMSSDQSFPEKQWALEGHYPVTKHTPLWSVGTNKGQLITEAETKAWVRSTMTGSHQSSLMILFPELSKGFSAECKSLGVIHSSCTHRWQRFGKTLNLWKKSSLFFKGRENTPKQNIDLPHPSLLHRNIFVFFQAKRYFTHCATVHY